MSALEKLMKKYRSISLVDIAKEFDKYNYPKDRLRLIKTELTGFSDTSKCILCEDAGLNERDLPNCKNCEWIKLTGNACDSRKNQETFDGITQAGTIEEIHKAYKKRANYIELVLELGKLTIDDCHFCGSDDYEIVEYAPDKHIQCKLFKVRCNVCDAEGPAELSKKDAVNSWNK